MCSGHAFAFLSKTHRRDCGYLLTSPFHFLRCAYCPICSTATPTSRRRKTKYTTGRPSVACQQPFFAITSTLGFRSNGSSLSLGVVEHTTHLTSKPGQTTPFILFFTSAILLQSFALEAFSFVLWRFQGVMTRRRSFGTTFPVYSLFLWLGRKCAGLDNRVMGQFSFFFFFSTSDQCWEVYQRSASVSFQSSRPLLLSEAVHFEGSPYLSDRRPSLEADHEHPRLHWN